MTYSVGKAVGPLSTLGRSKIELGAPGKPLDVPLVRDSEELMAPDIPKARRLLERLNHIDLAEMLGLNIEGNTHG